MFEGSQKIAYLDCPTGIAGDMCLGALVNAGVPLSYLQEQLDRLGLTGEFALAAQTVLRQGQAATRVQVQLTASTAPQTGMSSASAGPARHLKEIERLIQAAQLPSRVTTWSLDIFRRLAEAEGAVHGIAPDEVHFHEVGAVDAIVDIVGTCLGLDWLQVEVIACSALPTGGGMVRAAHGLLPVPAPAVLKLFQMGQVPVYGNGLQKELVTPTGAAIATTLAQHFGPPPAMTLHQVGLGAGGRDLPLPNILRLWIGQTPEGIAHNHSQSHTHSQSHSQPHAYQEKPHSADLLNAEAHLASAPSKVSEQVAKPPLKDSCDQSYGLTSNGAFQEPLAPGLEPVAVLETQVDDLSPQVVGYLYERLWEVGALDVFTQAVGMKKSRPGVLLTVICRPQQVEACEQVLFEETTTLGIRRQTQWRHALERSFTPVETPYGSVRLKLAYHPQNHQLLNVHPEFEDCAQLARQHKVPWQEVHRSALSHWQSAAESKSLNRSVGQ